MAGKTKPQPKPTKPADHTKEDKLDAKERVFFTPAGTGKAAGSMASVYKVFRGKAVVPNGKKVKFVVYAIKNIFSWENGDNVGTSLAAQYNYQVQGNVTWESPSAAGIGMFWSLPDNARELRYQVGEY